MYGGEIEQYHLLENNKTHQILLKVPVLAGDASSVGVRLGNNMIRMGFKCGTYYDIKGVDPDIIRKLKDQGTLLVGEANKSGVQRAYDAVVIQ